MRTRFWVVLLAILFQLPVQGHAQSRSERKALNALAIQTLNAIQARSISKNREYCGLLGYDSADNLVATKPRRGRRDSCNPGNEPRGFEVLASYHTHGGYSEDADSEVPSVSDLEADIDEGIDGYIATPGGRIWLNRFDRETATLLCGLGCVRSDPKFRPCRAMTPKKKYTLRGLERREDTDIDEC